MPEGVGKGKGKVCFESMHLRHFTEAGGISYGGHLLRQMPCIDEIGCMDAPVGPWRKKARRGRCWGLIPIAIVDDRLKTRGTTLNVRALMCGALLAQGWIAQGQICTRFSAANSRFARARCVIALLRRCGERSRSGRHDLPGS